MPQHPANVTNQRALASPYYRLNAPAVAAQIADGEAVLIHFDAGHYFSLNISATELFEWFTEGQQSLAQAGRLLALRYGLEDSEALEQVMSLVRQLESEGLIVSHTTSSPSVALPAVTAKPSSSFIAPSLSKYSDLEDLLKLDPIHDVDDAGWPAAKASD